MTEPATRPPYRAAVAVTLLVLAGYVLTLAPSVTFWDAGEFIAAAKVLGIRWCRSASSPRGPTC